MSRPRWVTPREAPAAARVIHAAYGGRYLRHLVKVVVTPHLTVHGHAAVLGVGADHGRRSPGRRVVDSVVHLAWEVAARKRPDDLPWVLRPTHTAGWRLVNLAKDPRRRAATPATIAISGYVFALADRAGMDVSARVDADQHRLLAAYLHRGFRVVHRTTEVLVLHRTARTRDTDRGWRSVLRTGRLTLSAWQARFGAAEGPFLDLGAGDSPLGAELVSSGVLALAVDPQFSVRPPERASHAVAATAEHLPFRDGAFVVVNANFVLQHVTGPRRALAECLRVTCPGGRLVLHPVWAWRFFRSRLERVQGVRVLPGRVLPPGRQRPSVVLSAGKFDVAVNGAQVAAALRPHPLVAWLGRVAMSLAIRAGVRGTR
ncbi:class I SAM-dependent methyltransferase [Saccharothrix texasensis]|uniref:class I SAM-dependent methyltransferase n=1 Tax=Saccharothrix texasensis TaxID=103734 RepID=UPI001B8689E5|nr:class I SAM-dependent methyltransferase [Saccharothrix texasensis]